MRVNINKLNFSLFVKKQKKTDSQFFYLPKNNNQVKYVNYLNEEYNKIIVSTGPAGTGKTLFACQKAITLMKNEEIQKIVLTRPIVTVDEDLGFLPGNIIKKMDPWTKPIFDIFLEYYSKTELDIMLFNGIIEICPLAFMRGRTFKNSFIIADEMQNSSPNQMKMLATRLGVNTRMIITGDLQQSDFEKQNGLFDFISRIKKFNETEIIKIVSFEENDIERSEIVKKVIQIYNNNNYLENIKQNDNNLIKKNYNKENISNNDAALIPKHHVTHNFYGL
jgi:phosphate starvation-inducible PhoH-like protein